MTSATSDGSRNDAPSERVTARYVFGVVVDPQTYRNILYLILSFPLGIMYFVGLTVGFALGISLAIVIVGIPILIAVVLVSRLFASFERHLANQLLEVEIVTPTDVRLPETRELWPTLRSYLGAVSTWKGIVYLYVKFWVGVASFVLVVVGIVVPVAFLTAPLHYNDPDVMIGFGPWVIDTVPEAIFGSFLGAGLGIFFLHLLNAAAWVSGLFARLLLGSRYRTADMSGTTPSEQPEKGP